MSFTIQELTTIAHDAFGDTATAEKAGRRYRFRVEQDDRSTMEYVNDMDALGRLGWPERDRDTGYDRRPAGFTGAAIKFGPTHGSDTVWWEPYRDGTTVYDGPDERAFMRDLLDYGTVCLSVVVFDHCDCCDKWSETDRTYLGGIESPLCGKGNYGYLAECFDDMLCELEDAP